MNTCRERLLDSHVCQLRELFVERHELVPALGAKHLDESREVEARMIADFLVARAFGGVHIKVNNLAVNIVTILEGRDERTNVLECSTANKLRVLVLKEVVVHLGQLLRLLVD